MEKFRSSKMFTAAVTFVAIALMLALAPVEATAQAAAAESPTPVAAAVQTMQQYPPPNPKDVGLTESCRKQYPTDEGAFQSCLAGRDDCKDALREAQQKLGLLPKDTSEIMSCEGDDRHALSSIVNSKSFNASSCGLFKANGGACSAYNGGLSESLESKRDKFEEKRDQKKEDLDKTQQDLTDLQTALAEANKTYRKTTTDALGEYTKALKAGPKSLQAAIEQAKAAHKAEFDEIDKQIGAITAKLLELKAAEDDSATAYDKARGEVDSVCRLAAHDAYNLAYKALKADEDKFKTAIKNGQVALNSPSSQAAFQGYMRSTRTLQSAQEEYDKKLNSCLGGNSAEGKAVIGALADADRKRVEIKRKNDNYRNNILLPQLTKLEQQKFAIPFKDAESAAKAKQEVDEFLAQAKEDYDKALADAQTALTEANEKYNIAYPRLAQKVQDLQKQIQDLDEQTKIYAARLECSDANGGGQSTAGGDRMDGLIEKVTDARSACYVAINACESETVDKTKRILDRLTTNCKRIGTDSGEKSSTSTRSRGRNPLRSVQQLIDAVKPKTAR